MRNGYKVVNHQGILTRASSLRPNARSKDEDPLASFLFPKAFADGLVGSRSFASLASISCLKAYRDVVSRRLKKCILGWNRICLTSIVFSVTSISSFWASTIARNRATSPEFRPRSGSERCSSEARRLSSCGN